MCRLHSTYICRLHSTYICLLHAAALDPHGCQRTYRIPMHAHHITCTHAYHLWPCTHITLRVPMHITCGHARISHYVYPCISRVAMQHITLRVPMHIVCGRARISHYVCPCISCVAMHAYHITCVHAYHVWPCTHITYARCACDMHVHIRYVGM